MINIKEDEISAKMVVKCPLCQEKTKINNYTHLLNGSLRVDYLCISCNYLYPIVLLEGRE